MTNKMLRGALLISITVALVTGVGWYYSASAAGTAAPGSPDDPIVTKSYVDRIVSEVLQDLSNSGVTGGVASNLEVVTLPFGSKLIVEGGGELIVRTGKAIAYSTDANGLSDMTDGKDIAPGKPVAANHLILFPRGGRGVEADPKQDKGLIVLVRGGYQIK